MKVEENRWFDNDLRDSLAREYQGVLTERSLKGICEKPWRALGSGAQQDVAGRCRLDWHNCVRRTIRVSHNLIDAPIAIQVESPKAPYFLGQTEPFDKLVEPFMVFPLKKQNKS
ncbi:hypothetical protein [Pseudomonas phoenicis]|uniref:hypothetical protein n=1 Tax=unclassified Pseudomonas TaxID=196821 RepID=UPI0039A05D4B